MTPTDLAVDCLAGHRLVRLLGADAITEPLREAVAGWAYRQRGRPEDHPGTTPEGGWATWAEFDEDPPKLAALVSCRWCLSVYVATAVVVARAVAPRWWRRAAWGLAVSSASVLLAGLEQD